MSDLLHPPTDALDRIDNWCLAIFAAASLGLLAIGLVAWWPL